MCERPTLNFSSSGRFCSSSCAHRFSGRYAALKSNNRSSARGFSYVFARPREYFCEPACLLSAASKKCRSSERSRNNKSRQEGVTVLVCALMDLGELQPPRRWRKRHRRAWQLQHRRHQHNSWLTRHHPCRRRKGGSQNPIGPRRGRYEREVCDPSRPHRLAQRRPLEQDPIPVERRRGRGLELHPLKVSLSDALIFPLYFCQRCIASREIFYDNLLREVNRDNQLGGSKLHSPFAVANVRLGEVSPHDACATCGSGGKLLCCSSCPLGFHFGCLDPPLLDVPSGDWYCRACETVRLPPQGELAQLRLSRVWVVHVECMPCIRRWMVRGPHLCSRSPVSPQQRHLAICSGRCYET